MSNSIDTHMSKYRGNIIIMLLFLTTIPISSPVTSAPVLSSASEKISVSNLDIYWYGQDTLQTDRFLVLIDVTGVDLTRSQLKVNVTIDQLELNIAAESTNMMDYYLIYWINVTTDQGQGVVDVYLNKTNIFSRTFDWDIPSFTAMPTIDYHKSVSNGWTSSSYDMVANITNDGHLSIDYTSEGKGDNPYEGDFHLDASSDPVEDLGVNLSRLPLLRSYVPPVIVQITDGDIHEKMWVTYDNLEIYLQRFIEHENNIYNYPDQVNEIFDAVETLVDLKISSNLTEEPLYFPLSLLVMLPLLVQYRKNQ